LGHGADLAAPRDDASRFAVTEPSWERVKELLHQALALDAQARATFLDAACGMDAALRAELESLLGVGDGLSAEFLRSPLREKPGAAGGAPGASVLAAGQIFAQRFQLVRRLGEGGMRSMQAAIDAMRL
jgi:hypothetical protein